jgi:hypothetical protein
MPHHLRPAFASAVCLLVLALPGIATEQPRTLRILLTNDDGFDAAGLKVMHTALVAAGHQSAVTRH